MRHIITTKSYLKLYSIDFIRILLLTNYIKEVFNISKIMKEFKKSKLAIKKVFVSFIFLIVIFTIFLAKNTWGGVRVEYVVFMLLVGNIVVVARKVETPPASSPALKLPCQIKLRKILKK